MQDLNALHKQLCPHKHFGNFIKSADFIAARASLAALPDAEVLRRSQASRGHPAQTLAHPVVALAFMHWANAELFYTRLQRIIDA